MESQPEARILAAVDSTLAAGSARFRCRCTGETGQLVASGEGVADLRRARSAMDIAFAFPEHVRAVASEVGTVTEGGTVYVRIPDLGNHADMPEPWVAFDTDLNGLSSSPIGIVAWLRGVTAAQRVVQPVDGSPVGRFKVDLDLDVAARRSPAAERSSFRRALESGQVGLATAATHGEIELDGADRVRWMRAAVPPGMPPWYLAAMGERSVELELYSFGVDLPIAVPDAEVRMPAEDFLGSITAEPEAGQSQA